MWYNLYNLLFKECRFGRKFSMKIIKLYVGDIVEMKKTHPCGNNLFKILRVGSEIRAVCIGCGRDMTIERVKFEKSIKKIINTEYQKGL